MYSYLCFCCCFLPFPRVSWNKNTVVSHHRRQRSEWEGTSQDWRKVNKILNDPIPWGWCSSQTCSSSWIFPPVKEMRNFGITFSANLIYMILLYYRRLLARCLLELDLDLLRTDLSNSLTESWAKEVKRSEQQSRERSISGERGWGLDSVLHSVCVN